jgi:acyl-CoA synthetase (AMP-forming)/AMP-acid ligase II
MVRLKSDRLMELLAEERVAKCEDFHSLIGERASVTPDRVAFVTEDGREISFAGYKVRVDKLAEALSRRGVVQGTRVSWQLPTSIAALVLVGALAKLGAVQNPILPFYRERELSFIVSQSRPDAFITTTPWRDVNFPSMASSVLLRTGVVTRLWVLDGEEVTSEVEEPITSSTPLGLPEPVRWIFYSSGTTSDPKGALHTDRSLMAGPRAMVDAYQVTKSDRYPIVFPFTHVGGVQMLILQLLSGCSAIVIDHFDLASTPGVLAELGMTMLAGGTPLATALLAHQRRVDAGPLFPLLRVVFAGAAPKPPGLHRALREEMGGIGALSCYGLTEAPMCVLSRFDDSESQLATTEGRAIPGCEVRTIGEGGAICPAGVEGELQVRGDVVCSGYVDARFDTEAFDADGFLHTGDLGVIDIDGCVRVVGRLKDVIIRKGEKISAPEVEAVVSTLSGVREVAVIGLTDEVSGERCCVVLELTDPNSTLTLTDVAAHCRSMGLAMQKIPEQVEVVSELPRNASGKVAKQDLKRQIERLNASRASTGIDRKDGA